MCLCKYHRISKRSRDTVLKTSSWGKHPCFSGPPLVEFGWILMGIWMFKPNKQVNLGWLNQLHPIIMFKLEGQVSKLGKKHQGYESGLAKTVASSWTTCNRSAAPFFPLGVPDPKGITRRNPSHRSRKGLGNNSWDT
jgi:hypothetical protein